MTKRKSREELIHTIRQQNAIITNLTGRVVNEALNNSESDTKWLVELSRRLDSEHAHKETLKTLRTKTEQLEEQRDTTDVFAGLVDFWAKVSQLAMQSNRKRRKEIEGYRADLINGAVLMVWVGVAFLVCGVIA